MTASGRDRLAVLVAGATEKAAFSAARTAPTGDLHLEVGGVGPIDLPVSQAQARQLCLLGREARYGHGEQTLVDRRVRDTWEVPKSRVKIDKRRLNRTLLPVLDKLGRDLGVPSGRALRAELHSMLVYAPGQFFVAHQDSEKDDAMVASLVVGLPSTFKGGALEVHHSGMTATYRGSKKALSFVAFFSDCRHEVKPVRSGYRVVLTYNLLVRREAATAAAEPDPELAAGVARCLDEHFAPSGGQDRLLYLLDHEYTRRGLDRSRLKGADAHRVALLEAAAERAGCEAVLGLADIHETWTAYEPDDYPRSGYGRWHDWDDDLDSFDDENDNYEVDELIESEVTLDCWIDSPGARPKDVGLSIGTGEVCASTPSGDLEPYRSEYEGYMGNWGNTLDRWYRRGAVLLWRRSRDFVVRAEAAPAAALDELTARARQGDVIGARSAAAELAPFWDGVAAQVEAKGFFTKAVRTARLLDGPAVASMLVRPFRLELLTTTHVKPLSALVGTYGEQWAEETIAAWAAKWRRYHAQGPEAWMASLPRLCVAFQEAGDAGALAARLVLRECWRWATHAIEHAATLGSPSERERAVSDLGPLVATVLDGASLLGATDVRDTAVGVLCRDDLLLGCAIAALRATGASRWNAVGLDVVAGHCSETLKARLARPPRASDDWSIELPEGCDCELCGNLRAFLHDPGRRSFEWPLAKDGRAHLHRRIDAAELPVGHDTRRVGRPYTLVLTKTDALFEREAQWRRRDEKDLAWLDRLPARRPTGSPS